MKLRSLALLFSALTVLSLGVFASAETFTSAIGVGEVSPPGQDEYTPDSISATGTAVVSVSWNCVLRTNETDISSWSGSWTYDIIGDGDAKRNVRGNVVNYRMNWNSNGGPVWDTVHPWATEPECGPLRDLVVTDTSTSIYVNSISY